MTTCEPVTEIKNTKNGWEQVAVTGANSQTWIMRSSSWTVSGGGVLTVWDDVEKVVGMWSDGSWTSIVVTSRLDFRTRESIRGSNKNEVA